LLLGCPTVSPTEPDGIVGRTGPGGGMSTGTAPAVTLSAAQAAQAPAPCRLRPDAVGGGNRALRAKIIGDAAGAPVVDVALPAGSSVAEQQAVESPSEDAFHDRLSPEVSTKIERFKNCSN
jgi:hypothetical protein